MRAALRSVPPDVGGLTLGAESLRRAGRDAHARAVLEQALRIAPGHRVVRNNLAWLLATSERPEVRDPGRAVELMQQLEAEAPLDAAERDTLERSLDALGMSP